MEPPVARHYDEWLIFVKDNLNNFEQSSKKPDVFIFSIAHPLLTLKPDAYIPQVISIGPYHHERLPQYQETDNYKLKMAQALEKSGKFSRLVKKIQSFDGSIRSYYDRHIPYDSEKLSLMLALDTIFILQFLKSSDTNNVEGELNAILVSIRETPLWYAIKNDILMLQNQVPMFLLNIVGDYIPGLDFQGRPGDILKMACSRFNPFMERPVSVELRNTRHVVDYLYHYVTAPSEKRELEFESENRHHAGGNLPSATELSEAGIQFAPYDSGDLREISFMKTSSTFLLPKITINDSTEVVLRNLVALELYSKKKEKLLTRYTYLMDRLIDTEKDVAVLKRCGVLHSEMGSDAEVALMWNSMSKSTWENRFAPIDNAIEEANKYYKNKWKVLLAEFLKTHCSKPWVIVSVLSAGILLSLSAVQVFCLFYLCNK